MLRHPVVISTIEEDFQKIGLITEAKKAPEETAETAPEEDETVGLEDLDLEDSQEEKEESGVIETSWLSYQSAPALAEDDDEDDDDITEGEVAAFEEAVQFAEAFDKEWSECDEDSEISLSQEDMEELEGMGESLGLDFDVLNLDEDDDEATDDDSDDDSDSDDKE